MGFRETIEHAFAMPKEEEKLTKEEEELLNKLAQEVVKRGLEAIAITSLESVKYLNFVGSQVMLFLKPIVDTVLPTQVYGKVQKILEKRGSVDYLIQAIEKAVV